MRPCQIALSPGYDVGILFVVLIGLALPRYLYKDVFSIGISHRGTRPEVENPTVADDGYSVLIFLMVCISSWLHMMTVIAPTSFSFLTNIDSAFRWCTTSSQLCCHLSILGGIAALIGIALWTWSNVVLAEHWARITARGGSYVPSPCVVGPYALFEHPMYIAFAIAAAGVILVAADGIVAVFWGLAVANFLLRVAPAETAYMRAIADSVVRPVDGTIADRLRGVFATHPTGSSSPSVGTPLLRSVGDDLI